MDSGELVENGLADPSPTVDRAMKEVDFKVVEKSADAGDAEKDDGDFQGSVAAPLYE